MSMNPKDLLKMKKDLSKNGILAIEEGIAKAYGTGCHVGIPKKYLGKNALIMILE